MGHKRGGDVLRRRRLAPLLLTLATGPAFAGPFASVVHEYRPAPGQFVNNPAFNDPERALGAPLGGGTAAPDNSKVVSLGGFGGSITLGFDQTVLDDSRNERGLDAIVFSNAIWIAGDPNLKFAELAVIEISRDENGNGIADDPWYVIPGTSIAQAPEETPADALREQGWDDDSGTPTPPANLSWYPNSGDFPELAGDYATSAFELPMQFATDRLANPNGGGSMIEADWGYAEHTPTLLLGDFSGADGSLGDNNLADEVDQPGIAPAVFYTWPDDPEQVGVSSGSGGGDAFDIAWALDPVTGEPADLDGFDFIRVRTSVDGLLGPGGILGELSSEISAVADVRPVGDLTGDGVVSAADIAELISRWGDASPLADLSGDGQVNAVDLATLIGNWDQ